MTTFGAVVQVVRATDLLALVPSEVVGALAPDLMCHEPPVALPSMAMALLWHPRHTTQPRHRALRRVIADAIRAQVDGAA